MRALVVLMISFLLEGIIDSYLPIGKFLFTLMGLIYFCLFSKFSKKNIIMISALIGFVYDIIYMNMIMTNMLLFTVIAYLLVRNKYEYNFKNIFILTSGILLFYILCLYLLFLINGSITLNLLVLLKSILIIFIINIIYSFLLSFLYKRSKGRKIPIYYYR